jgi:dTDP-4-dehydrorhamnose reductase
MNILILGHKGMLGHMLVKYFTDKGYNVHTTDARFKSVQFGNMIMNFHGDFIINAIGAIPQKTNDFSINAELPIWLDVTSNVPVIHPGTDCEMDDDEYGISKRKARDYIVNNGVRTKIIRASIIGPELNDKKSLLEWFLNNDEVSCNGFTKAMWNGITTYEWAVQCEQLMNNWDVYLKETIISGNCISKFALLDIIASVFEKSINILPIELGIDKCLVADIKTKNIKEQLIELKEYYYDNRR